MILAAVSAGWLLAAQAVPAAPLTCTASGTNTAEAQLCLAQQEARRAEGFLAGAPERREHQESAATYFRRAADLGTTEVKLPALVALAELYDTKQLNEPRQREIVLRELIDLSPDELRYVFDLARLHEAEGFPELAEESLLAARRQYPDRLEAYKELSQFYVRRVVALQARQREQTPSDPPVVGTPDQDGVYRVGGGFKPPRRLDRPEYPADAQAAGITGAVEAEIVIGVDGTVTDARVVKSVPYLDEPALEAVREWRFAPTLVNGEAVPVRMTVTVNFTLSQ